MNNKKIHEPYNLPTLDDFFERTHGSYMGRVEKIDTITNNGDDGICVTLNDGGCLYPKMLDISQH